MEAHGVNFQVCFTCGLPFDYRYHGQPARNYILEMGYTRADCPDHGEVSEYFCRHFCDRFNAGWFSPILYNFRGALWKAGALQAVDSILVSLQKN